MKGVRAWFDALHPSVLDISNQHSFHLLSSVLIVKIMIMLSFVTALSQGTKSHISKVE